MGRRSAGGYRIAVEGHRWRPADEQERSRLTRIAVDRGAEPQTVPVISAPLILDGPGHPGAGRSSCRCCAVMVVTRLKDAVAAVSRICGRGSPIPIFAQVRGILTIVMHRCAAAIGSAHGRAPRRRRSVPSGPGPTAWWSLVIDSTCQVCAMQPHPGSSPLPAAPHPATLPHRLQGRCLADRRRTPTSRASHTDSRTAADTAGDIPRGRVRILPSRGIRRRRGQQSRPRTRSTSPAGRKCPRTRRLSPHASDLSETRRTLVVPNAARRPRVGGTGARGWRPTPPPPTPPSSAQPCAPSSRLETADDR